MQGFKDARIDVLSDIHRIGSINATVSLTTTVPLKSSFALAVVILIFHCYHGYALIN